ncbi:hypothetical protein HDU97_010050 [Phlyctochytrium planicorne]|nr:hypothetical protein HDU97_010050 [Phlyctochytrium planicorne]
MEREREVVYERERQRDRERERERERERLRYEGGYERQYQQQPQYQGAESGFLSSTAPAPPTQTTNNASHGMPLGHKLGPDMNLNYHTQPTIPSNGPNHQPRALPPIPGMPQAPPTTPNAATDQRWFQQHQRSVLTENVALFQATQGAALSSFDAVAGASGYQQQGQGWQSQQKHQYQAQGSYQQPYQGYTQQQQPYQPQQRMQPHQADYYPEPVNQHQPPQPQNRALPQPPQQQQEQPQKPQQPLQQQQMATPPPMRTPTPPRIATDAPQIFPRTVALPPPPPTPVQQQVAPMRAPTPPKSSSSGSSRSGKGGNGTPVIPTRSVMVGQTRGLAGAQERKDVGGGLLGSRFSVVGLGGEAVKNVGASSSSSGGGGSEGTASLDRGSVGAGVGGDERDHHLQQQQRVKQIQQQQQQAVPVPRKGTPSPPPSAHHHHYQQQHQQQHPPPAPRTSPALLSKKPSTRSTLTDPASWRQSNMSGSSMAGSEALDDWRLLPESDPYYYAHLEHQKEMEREWERMRERREKGISGDSGGSSGVGGAAAGQRSSAGSGGSKVANSFGEMEPVSSSSTTAVGSAATTPAGSRANHYQQTRTPVHSSSTSSLKSHVSATSSRTRGRTPLPSTPTTAAMDPFHKRGSDSGIQSEVSDDGWVDEDDDDEGAKNGSNRESVSTLEDYGYYFEGIESGDESAGGSMKASALGLKGKGKGRVGSGGSVGSFGIRA